MSQLSIKLSDKADALIAQLQKEIFNRRRKKVTAAGVVETLVESGARSQSDKRFSTSWANLIKDIEKAAKLANAHGSKPSSLTDAEWAMVLSHRQRAATEAPSKSATRSRATKSAAKPVAAGQAKRATKSISTTTAKTDAKGAKTVRKASTSTTTSAAARKPRPAKRARKTSTGTGTTSVATRMAKAAGRLGSSGSLSSSGISSPARS